MHRIYIKSGSENPIRVNISLLYTPSSKAMHKSLYFCVKHIRFFGTHLRNGRLLFMVNTHRTINFSKKALDY